MLLLQKPHIFIHLGDSLVFERDNQCGYLILTTLFNTHFFNQVPNKQAIAAVCLCETPPLLSEHVKVSLKGDHRLFKDEPQKPVQV